MSEKFQEYIKNNYSKGFEPFGSSKSDMKKGWDACKDEVLEILKKDWIGADLSINSCDEYYIEKIKDL